MFAGDSINRHALENDFDSVGSFEAKTHLPALLDRVANGESIQITRRGVPVARLVPVSASSAADRRKLAGEIRELRKGIKLGGISIRRLIAEGRRY
jgi:prevent-host-death family protein